MISLLAPRGLRSETHGREDGWLRMLQSIGRKTTAGVRVSESNALTYSAVWAATRLFGIGGSIPLQMFQRKGQGNERAREYPLERLLRWKFNPEMEACNGRRLLWHWQVNWGNAVCEKSINDETGHVEHLWPLEPWRTRCERNTATGELRWVHHPENGEPRYLSQAQVFHLPNVITHDGLIGIGTIAAARETIGFGLGTERYGANYFGGDGVPRIVISHPGQPMKDDARKSFREEWQAIMGGPEGSKVATIGGDAKVIPITISQEDSQFLETRQHNIEEIARWYGIPPHLLQRMVQVTYNNAEILPIDFVKWTLLQYIEVWESAISTQLIPEEDRDEYFAKHNLNGLLRGDSKARVEYYNGMSNIGALHRNRIRELEDEEPVEGGNTFLVQGAMVPLDEDGKPESEFAGSVPGEKPANPNGGDPGAQLAKAKAAVKRAIHYHLAKLSEREGKRAIEESRKVGSFVSGVDGFYSSHAAVMTDTLTPLFEALGQTATDFVATWCSVAKESILAAADSAKNAAELEQAVKVVVSSHDWTSRALKAITLLEAE